MRRPKGPLPAWITEQRKAQDPEETEGKGWKVEELARRIGVSPNTIRGWEAPRGRPPKPENLEALEKVFGVQAPGGGDVGAQGDVAAAIRDQTDAINRHASALEDLVKTIAARLDQFGAERRADHDALVADLTAVVRPLAMAVAAVGGSDADAAPPTKTDSRGPASQ